MTCYQSRSQQKDTLLDHGGNQHGTPKLVFFTVDSDYGMSDLFFNTVSLFFEYLNICLVLFQYQGRVFLYISFLYIRVLMCSQFGKIPMLQKVLQKGKKQRHNAHRTLVQEAVG